MLLSTWWCTLFVIVTECRSQRHKWIFCPCILQTRWTFNRKEKKLGSPKPIHISLEAKFPKYFKIMLTDKIHTFLLTNTFLQQAFWTSHSEICWKHEQDRALGNHPTKQTWVISLCFLSFSLLVIEAIMLYTKYARTTHHIPSASCNFIRTRNMITSPAGFCKTAKGSSLDPTAGALKFSCSGKFFIQIFHCSVILIINLRCPAVTDNYGYVMFTDMYLKSFWFSRWSAKHNLCEPRAYPGNIATLIKLLCMIFMHKWLSIIVKPQKCSDSWQDKLKVCSPEERNNKHHQTNSFLYVLLGFLESQARCKLRRIIQPSC